MNYRLYLVSLRLRPVNRRALAPSAASATPPESGQPFQATTVAVSGINAAICCAAAEFATRTQATATGVAAAAAAYAHQEATAASEMAAVTQVTVV